MSSIFKSSLLNNNIFFTGLTNIFNCFLLSLKGVARVNILFRFPGLSQTFIWLKAMWVFSRYVYKVNHITPHHPINLILVPELFLDTYGQIQIMYILSHLIGRSNM